MSPKMYIRKTGVSLFQVLIYLCSPHHLGYTQAMLKYFFLHCHPLVCVYKNWGHKHTSFTKFPQLLHCPTDVSKIKHIWSQRIGGGGEVPSLSPTPSLPHPLPPPPPSHMCVEAGTTRKSREKYYTFNDFGKLKNVVSISFFFIVAGFP